MKFIAMAVLAMSLTACSLTQPPPPPAVPPEWLGELRAQPDTTRTAAEACVRSYAAGKARIEAAIAEIARAAVIECREQIEAHKAALIQAAQATRRGFAGFGHPNLTRARREAEAIDERMREIASAVVITARE
jgi:hypothetical protein